MQKLSTKTVKKLTREWVAKKVPYRPKDANKGTFGKVLVVAGSENYPGAAYLACAGCYRVGAGLVTLATEQTVKIIVSRQLPEVIFLSVKEALDRVGEYEVLLVGPGLGQSDQTVKLVEQIINGNLLPKVIDAGGLNILSKIGEWWERLKGDVILTPHPGEMARLTGLSIKEIQANRINVAQYFAKKWNKIIILKGANTVVVSPAGQVLFSPFSNPVLSTAGTGDVLAGILAGLMAQGLIPFDAAGVGVYIHGLAGEMVSRKMGDAGMLASDLLPMIPKVIKNLKGN